MVITSCRCWAEGLVFRHAFRVGQPDDHLLSIVGQTQIEPPMHSPEVPLDISAYHGNVKRSLFQVFDKRAKASPYRSTASAPPSAARLTSIPNRPSKARAISSRTG